MIRRIVLENFMAHSRTVLDFAPGVTVIVGRNNVGKSAVVEALRCVSGQDSVGKALIRHGADKAKVTVYTEEGDRIEWIREPGTAYRKLNGRDFGRLGRQVHPDVEKALRMKLVEGVDIHLSDQKDPIFLFNRKSSEIARFFASASDVDLLIRMQLLFAKRIFDDDKELKALFKERTRWQSKQDCLIGLPEVEESLREAQSRYSDCAARSEKSSALAEAIDDLELALDLAESSAQTAFALKSVAPPPTLQPTERLAHICDAIGKTLARQTRDAARAKAASRLTLVPQFAPTESLRKLLTDLQRAGRVARALKTSQDTLSNLGAPPELGVSERLARLTADLSRHSVARTAATERLTLIAEQQAEIAAKLKNAVRGVRCPTCGGELKLETLLEVGP